MNQSRSDIMLFLMMALVCVSPVHAEPILDSSAAIEAALAYSGLETFVRSPEKREKHVSAVLENVTDSILPSLNGEKTQAVWKVQLDSIQLLDYGACSRVRGFEIYLEAKSGVFLMARTINDIDSTYYKPQPEWEYMEMELSTSFRDVVGYPEIVPPTTMLNAWYSAYFSAPCRAEEVLVYLVTVQHKENEPHPCWIVIGRSTRAVDMSHVESMQDTTKRPPPTRSPRQNWVTLVHAGTNQGICAFNIK